MDNKRICRWLVLAAACVAFALMAAVLWTNEQMCCIGVRLLKADEMDAFCEYVYADLQDVLLFKGEPAAIDVASSTIYIPQNLDEQTTLPELVGELTVTDSSYSLYFAPNEGFDALADTAAKGEGFRLLAQKEDRTYMEYQVVFTTMPVMRIDGVYSYMDDEQREVMEGSVCVWTPQDPKTGGYTVNQSAVEWNIRGHSTSYRPKKSYKLSLKNAQGENADLSLLGLGADDDWILNAMAFDDCKVREKLIMDLWNTMTETDTYNLKMSAGEYVEVIRNGTYAGVYLLQRRLDDKYLDLKPNQVAIRGEKVYSPNEEMLKAAYMVMSGVEDHSNCAPIDLQNWIDIELFVDFTFAPDNASYFYNNICYVITNPETAPRVTTVLWDTDMILGMCYENGLVYRPTWAASDTRMQRREYGAMERLYPTMYYNIAARWQQLRGGILHRDYILGKVSGYIDYLEQSGALERDRKIWGTYSGEEDTIEMLRYIIEYRLDLLDRIYGVG